MLAIGRVCEVMKCKNKKCVPVKGTKYVYCKNCKVVIEVIH